MSKLIWDAAGERKFETGVDRGVLYIPNAQGVYDNGVAWNGLTGFTESPSGAEANALYADNIKYLNLISIEEFGGTLEAYTYPDEFMEFDGQVEMVPGVAAAQQVRPPFGLSYRTRVGNDLEGDGLGHKLHLVYGCQASPSEKAFASVNDSPDAINFSWEIETTPIEVTTLVNGKTLRPLALLTVDSTVVDPTKYATLEGYLWGTVSTDPWLPTPDEVYDLFAGSVTEVTPTEPAFDNVDEITIPSITGVAYYHNGVMLSSGAYTITEDALIEARPMAGYTFPAVIDVTWVYTFGG